MVLVVVCRLWRKVKIDYSLVELKFERGDFHSKLSKKCDLVFFCFALLCFVLFQLSERELYIQILMRVSVI